MSQKILVNERISVAAPVLTEKEKANVLECLDTTWISSAGRFITEFEQRFAERTQTSHAVAVCNGTVAIHLLLTALGVQPGDEIIIPSLTFVATANAVVQCGAIPVLADCDPRTLNITAGAIAPLITPKTRGVIVVHLYGHPCDMDPILELAQTNNLFVIEDAAEALGATYRGRQVGSLARAATFSLFGNKIITTGEGGMITTSDAALADKMRILRGQGMDPTRRYWHPVPGFNYRMTNIAAAIGCGQIQRLDQAVDARLALSGRYHELLRGLESELFLPVTEPYATHSFWMYTVLLRQGGEARRDAIMQFLDARGIETRPVFYPMHIMPPFFCEGICPVATQMAASGFNLPTHELLSEADLLRIGSSLGEALQACPP